MSRVFIASSERGRTYAESIARSLDREGHSPLLWWSTELFPINRTLIDSLCRLGELADGAIVVATPDDTKGMEGVQLGAPSANVILEYGYFIGALGPQRVAVVLVGNARLPSDLGGVVNIEIPLRDTSRTGSANYDALHVHEKIGNWLIHLDAVSSDGRRIADLLDRLGPSETQNSRIALKAQVLKGKVRYNAISKLPNGEVARLLERYSTVRPDQEALGYEEKTPVKSWINFAAVPPDSDDERSLAAHLARFFVDLIRKRKIQPTLVAISKPGATPVVEAAARLLPFPVVSVNPAAAPTQDRIVEGFYEIRDRVVLLHDVVLSGRHLVDCVSALRSVGLVSHDLVTFVQHEAETANLLALMNENGVRMHAATRSGLASDSRASRLPASTRRFIHDDSCQRVKL